MSDNKKTLALIMAERYNIPENTLKQTILKTVFPSDKPVKDEHLISFLQVAHEYHLNPFLREIHAFPNKGGGISTIVGIDGWLNIINSHSQYDGAEFIREYDQDKKLVSITCRIYRKDRNRPTEATEFMSECYKDTPAWNKWPSRMLQHKAMIQAARYAFGFAGIYDPDEAERIKEAEEAGTDDNRMAKATGTKSDELKQKIADTAEDAEFKDGFAEKDEPTPKSKPEPEKEIADKAENQPQADVSPEPEVDDTTKEEKTPSAAENEAETEPDDDEPAPQTAETEDKPEDEDSDIEPMGNEKYKNLAVELSNAIIDAGGAPSVPSSIVKKHTGKVLLDPAISSPTKRAVVADLEAALAELKQ